MRSQKGIALIEVLVTALVLAVGIMGMAGLQMKSVQFNQASYLRSQANVLAYDVMERMRLNRTRARAGDYDMDFGQSMSGTSLARQDLRAWSTLLSSTLPNGQGHVDCGEDTCTVEVRWKESADANAVTATGGANSTESWIVATYNTRI